VSGAPAADAITVDMPLHGKRAVTRFRALERLRGGATVLECSLMTGRTHQIRLHAKSQGHPVLGDARYGSPTPIDPPRMALHAARLGFVHPKTRAPLTFESALPSDLAGWLDWLRIVDPGSISR